MSETSFIQHPAGDVTAATAIVATWMGLLPNIAAGLAVIYYIILVIEKLVKWWSWWKQRGAPPSAPGKA